MVTGLKPNLTEKVFGSLPCGTTSATVAGVFKALGDETRLAIVQMLIDKELCVCEILAAFEMSQPAISHHLKILRQAGVVQDTREGKWIHYQLNPSALELLSAVLQTIQKDIGSRNR